MERPYVDKYGRLTSRDHLLDLTAPPDSVQELFRGNDATSILSLPRELRDEIYKFTMGSRQILILFDHHLGCFSKATRKPRKARSDGESGLCYFSTTDDTMIQSLQMPASNEPISQIYRVSRRFYLETRMLSYSFNVFSCWNPIAFMHWTCGTRTEHLNTIRRLSIPHYFSSMMKTEDLTDLWKGLKIVYFSFHSKKYVDSIKGIRPINRYDPAEPLNDTEIYWKDHGVRMVYLEPAS